MAKAPTCPEYNSWASMWARCTNENHPAWKHYGGRGITVCERWRNFYAFVDDMGYRPIGCSLDRIDPNGHYEPSNTRWATAKTQGRNKRGRRLYTACGESRTIEEWEAEAGLYVEPGELRRLARNGKLAITIESHKAVQSKAADVTNLAGWGECPSSAANMLLYPASGLLDVVRECKLVTGMHLLRKQEATDAAASRGTIACDAVI